jgi:outer membrane protein assembly factor BamB
LRAADEALPEYRRVEPVYESGFDEPLIELELTLRGPVEEVVVVRLMQRQGEVTQSFLVPGRHPYVSEGCLLSRQPDGFKGRILLSKETRGGPARGMGTPRGSRSLDIELKRDGERLAASCRSDGSPVPVAARLVSWEELARRNDPLRPALAWPAWHGPGCNFAAEPAGHELVDRLDGARLVWKSQERFGSGKAQSPRYGVIGLDSGRLPLLPGAGGASPVVAEGNAYVNYFMPSGDAVDEALLEQRREKAGDKPLPPWEMELWRIVADDCIACIDGRTGQTRWRTVYPGAGANWHDSKAGPCNVTPCLWRGKIYAIGSTGRVYCLDAAKGKEIWQSSIGPRHLAIEAAKRDALRQRRYGKLTFNRDFGGAPIVANGVVAMPDFTSKGPCGLLGLDAQTGHRRWRIPNVASEDAVPLRYEHDGQEYVISGVAGTGQDEPGRVVCVEPSSGRVLWAITEGIRGNREVMSIWRDYLIARAPATVKPHVETKKEPTALSCFRISPAGYEHLWTLPGEQGFWSEQPPAIADGYLYARLIGARLLCIEVATGKIVAAEENRVGFSAGTLVCADGRLIVDRDGSHSGTELYYFEVDPQRGIFRQLGGPWLPPHAHGTSYHPTHSFPYVDGRLLIRGADGIYCYDLRKTPGP